LAEKNGLELFYQERIQNNLEKKQMGKITKFLIKNTKSVWEWNYWNKNEQGTKNLAKGSCSRMKNKR